jgi:hypothetical protein
VIGAFSPREETVRIAAITVKATLTSRKASSSSGGQCILSLGQRAGLSLGSRKSCKISFWLGLACIAKALMLVAFNAARAGNWHASTIRNLLGRNSGFKKFLFF